jgi:hypothetical protein
MIKKSGVLFLAIILFAGMGLATSTQFNIVTQVKGILPVANGGTGLSSLATLVAGGNVVKTVSGTSTLTAATVTTNTCQTAITTTAAGAATTDAIEWAYASAPGTGDGLMTLSAYPTSGSVNFKRCNSSSASQTGTAIVINWRIER